MSCSNTQELFWNIQFLFSTNFPCLSWSESQLLRNRRKKLFLAVNLQPNQQLQLKAMFRFANVDIMLQGLPCRRIATFQYNAGYEINISDG